MALRTSAGLGRGWWIAWRSWHGWCILSSMRARGGWGGLWAIAVWDLPGLKARANRTCPRGRNRGQVTKRRNPGGQARGWWHEVPRRVYALERRAALG